MTLGEKKEFAAIDYFRIVLAIGVVALHLKPLSGINENIQYFIGNVLTRLCVPCFFLITGFFIESKIDEPQKVKKYILHIVQLYVVYTILYFPQVIFTYLQEGKSFLYIIFGYCRMFFFIGSAIHLWYLVATVVAVCILYVVVRIQGGGKSADIRLAIVAILLYIIGVLGNTYLLEWVQSQHYNVLWLYNILFSTTRNGIFFGFPFVATGYLISKYKKKIVYRNYLFPALVSFICLVLEISIIHTKFNIQEIDMSFCLAPVCIFVFLSVLFIKCDTNYNDKSTLYLRKLSFLLYGFHIIVDYVLWTIVYTEPLSNFAKFLVSLLITIVLSKLILKYQGKYKCLRILA